MSATRDRDGGIMYFGTANMPPEAKKHYEKLAIDFFEEQVTIHSNAIKKLQKERKVLRRYFIFKLIVLPLELILMPFFFGFGSLSRRWKAQKDLWEAAYGNGKVSEFSGL